MGENNLKSNRNDAISAHMLVALRRVMRAIDLHSRRLQQSHGLTGPQAVIIGQVIASQGLTPWALHDNRGRTALNAFEGFLRNRVQSSFTPL